MPNLLASRAPRVFAAVGLFAACHAPNAAVAETSDVELSGDILQVLIPAAGYAATFAFDDKEGRIQFYKSFAANMVATEVLKQTVDKERPNGSDNHAFPSRHTSAAFQGAAFLHERYGWKYGLPAYTAAAYVGWTRIDADEHDFEDVAAGAALGVLSSLYFTKPYKGFKVTPTASASSYGITISKAW